MIHRGKQLAAAWVLAACSSLYCQSPLSPPNFSQRDVAGASLPASGGPRRITLEQAQQQAAAAGDPMAHLAQLQVEAATQHRLGAESDYFPKISSTLTNFHFNKFMGERITVERPIAGGTATVELPLAGKDQTLVAVTAAQPVTPLFKLREVVNIARADETVARAKAGMPVETASNVEKSVLRSARCSAGARSREGRCRQT